MKDEFYAHSWAVFSLLVTKHRDQLIRYLERLDRVSEELPRAPWYGLRRARPEAELERRRALWRTRQAEAWRYAFPDLPPDQLDRELWQWMVAHEYRLPRIEVTVREVPIAERTLAEADVRALRGWMAWTFDNGEAEARSEARAALAIDPTNLLAQLALARLTHSIAAEDARATAAAHPDDWRALRLVELAHHCTPEGDEVRARLCSISPNPLPECPRGGKPAVTLD